MSSESEGDGDESLEEVVGVPAMRPVPPSTVVGVVQGLVDVELSRSRLGPWAPPAEVGPRGGQDIGLKWLRCEHVDIFIFSLWAENTLTSMAVRSTGAQHHYLTEIHRHQLKKLTQGFIFVFCILSFVKATIYYLLHSQY